MRFLRFFSVFAPLALVCSLVAQSALAAASPWLDHGEAKVRLLAAQDSVGDSGALRLGLQVVLQPGWKIYWRTPGEAGFPPHLDWSDSGNLESATMQWPVPERFSLFGLETFGYADEVVLPIEVELSKPGAPASLRAHLRYLICEEICIPNDGELVLDLPSGPQTSARESLLIEQYRARVPGSGAEAGLSLDSALLTGDMETPTLEVAVLSSETFEAPDLLVEGPPGYLFGKPEVTIGSDGKSARLLLASSRGATAEGVLEGKSLTLTLTDGPRRGLESLVVARYGEGTADLTTLGGGQRGAVPAGMQLSLWAALGLALVGGLILNLMPCVLPVLSIKLLSAIGHGGRESGPVRIGFLASAAGILFSFMLLAVLAIGLKSAGMAVGWGIQFQQPVFLVAMALIVTLFACNLFGAFEIRLPGFLADLALAGPAPSGEAHGQGHGLLGHFLTGAFATLLATPCTAPFLGTAVGFALAGGSLEILMIFAALGLGLAAPYLLIAAVPALATSLPRPGPWMITLKRILGLALLATAVWLLTVLASQIGWLGAGLIGGLLLLAGLAIGIGDRLPGVARGALVALAALAALGAPLAFESPASRAGVALENWEPLDTARIRELVAEGRIVFVDVTADWCLTCQVNKSLVLDSESVARELADERIVTMRGDWTLPDPAITDYLTSFGRYGIPFNAVYGPSTPNGEPLPELLTVDTVLQSLQRAGGVLAQN